MHDPGIHITERVSFKPLLHKKLLEQQAPVRSVLRFHEAETVPEEKRPGGYGNIGEQPLNVAVGGVLLDMPQQSRADASPLPKMVCIEAIDVPRALEFREPDYLPSVFSHEHSIVSKSGFPKLVVINFGRPHFDLLRTIITHIDRANRFIVKTRNRRDIGVRIVPHIHFDRAVLAVVRLSSVLLHYMRRHAIDAVLIFFLPIRPYPSSLISIFSRGPILQHLPFTSEVVTGNAESA